MHVSFLLKCESLKGNIATQSGEGIFCFFVVGGWREIGQSGEHNIFTQCWLINQPQICWFVRLRL
jgi:hypothetical protein